MNIIFLTHVKYHKVFKIIVTPPFKISFLKINITSPRCGHPNNSLYSSDIEAITGFDIKTRTLC